MTSISAQNAPSSNSAKTLCQIVGFACLGGFLVDLFVLGFPPNPANLEWRIAFMQQVGDRSVILLFGLALLIYGVIDSRKVRKQLALACLVIGILFNLSSILVIRDSLTLQDQALKAISTQAAQVQSQIEQVQQDPSKAPNLKPDQLERASQLISTQATTVKENAKTGVLKNGVSTVGNLVVIGLALIGLAQFAARPPRG
jgi:hypothetical protein